jgi:hypothetical protein
VKGEKGRGRSVRPATEGQQAFNFHLHSDKHSVPPKVQLRETAQRRPNPVGEGHCACQSTAAPSYSPRAIRRASFAATWQACGAPQKRSSVQASITTLAVTPAQEGGCPPARRWGSPKRSSRQSCGELSRIPSPRTSEGVCNNCALEQPPEFPARTRASRLPHAIHAEDSVGRPERVLFSRPAPAGS